MRRESKIKNKASQNHTKRNVIIGVVVALLLGGGAFAGYYFMNQEKEAPKAAPVEAKLINPLTGLEAKKLQSRPMMLSTDNDSYLSRPHSGVSKADVVYEVPIEGGGSRMEMIFYSQVPGKIGPARSARPYIVDIAREYKAIFVHNGWSKAARAYLETNVVPYIPAALNWEYFYRSKDRNIPHNCYTTGKDVWKCAKEKGYDEKQDIDGFKFLEKDEKLTGKEANNIVVNYVGTKNTYKYNKDTKTYDRYTGGDAYTDKENGKVISPANVIIQKVNIEVLDKEGRLKIDMTEGGEGTLFTQGMEFPIKWSRSGLDARTIFTDETGEEIKLTPGQTFFQVIDYTVKASYK